MMGKDSATALLTNAFRNDKLCLGASDIVALFSLTWVDCRQASWSQRSWHTPRDMHWMAERATFYNDGTDGTGNGGLDQNWSTVSLTTHYFPPWPGWRTRPRYGQISEGNFELAQNIASRVEKVGEKTGLTAVPWFQLWHEARRRAQVCQDLRGATRPENLNWGSVSTPKTWGVSMRFAMFSYFTGENVWNVIWAADSRQGLFWNQLRCWPRANFSTTKWTRRYWTKPGFGHTLGRQMLDR